ncbi:MAG: hypothetical protein H0U53_04730 [Actinobacteria bacterium]|nr:hypothetical protein [Actinomycetota bacterium]
MDQNGAQPSSGQIVVPEKSRVVDLLWGFLTVGFALALVRGHFGAETSTGRIVGDVIFGALLIGTVCIWWRSRRDPARLEVSPEAIRYTFRGARNPITLSRAEGNLYLRIVFTGGRVRTPLRYLKVTGSDQAILMHTFDWSEVERACIANGWRFVTDPGPDSL